MRVSIVTALAALLCSVTMTAAFFTYDDCDDTCKREFNSCIISEETKKFFICHCIKSELACEELATPVVVCLRPGGAPALGGAKIWNDFRNQNESTTTARPQPQPQPAIRKFWKDLLMGCAVMIVLFTLTALSFFIKRRLRGQQYEEIRNPDSPYQDTIENLS